MDFGTSVEDRESLSTIAAGPRQRRLAFAVVLVSIILFFAAAPFAKLQLRPMWAFIPIYETTLFLVDSITSILLFSQFAILRSRALLVLASGYLFTASMTVAHALSFPGLFSPTGLLGAGPQTTMWLYVFWHIGFALFLIGFSLLEDDVRASDISERRARIAILASVAAVLLVSGSLTLLATSGQAILPVVMQGNSYGPGAYVVALAGWPIGLLALAVLLRRKPRSVLDVWIVVVVCVQVLEVALSATLNAGRFDLGFYLGRVYGLLAVSFVLIILLIDNSEIYATLVANQTKLRRLSAIDPLTGIGGRRMFDETLKEEWRGAMRNGTTLAMLLIDVDDFKSFNDTYGHVAGDGCLRMVANTLAAGRSGAGETLARYGGDEFAMLLPESDLATAFALGRHLCQQIDRARLHPGSSTAARASISVGVACLSPKRGASPGATALIEAADRALYAAKAAGRNRVAAEGDHAALADTDVEQSGVAGAVVI
jgi:diguanylate cyclase (GGDEF)-like protein